MEALPAVDPLEIWPENWRIVEVFLAMDTQWYCSGLEGRPLGLRYESLPAVLRCVGVPKADFSRVFHGLRIMERVVLEEIRHG